MVNQHLKIFVQLLCNFSLGKAFSASTDITGHKKIIGKTGKLNVLRGCEGLLERRLLTREGERNIRDESVRK